jgi:hypothetical protein
MSVQEGSEIIIAGEPGLLPAEQEVSLVEGVPEVVEGEWEEVPEEKVVQEPRIAISEKETAAYKAGVAVGRAGGVAGKVLSGIGAKLEASGPPGDDFSDLFRGPDMNKDNDVYIKDLVTVDEEDVYGPGGADMSDLLEVDDVLEGLKEEEPAKKTVIVQRRKATPPSSGLAGLQL